MTEIVSFATLFRRGHEENQGWQCLTFPIYVIAFYWYNKHNNWDAFIRWTASSEFGTYRLCLQRRFRRTCTSAQSRQNLRCSLIQAVNQEELSDRKPDPWPLWMAGHAQLKFVMTECSKTQIRLRGLISYTSVSYLYWQSRQHDNKEARWYDEEYFEKSAQLP